MKRALLLENVFIINGEFRDGYVIADEDTVNLEYGDVTVILTRDDLEMLLNFIKEHKDETDRSNQQST